MLTRQEYKEIGVVVIHDPEAQPCPPIYRFYHLGVETSIRPEKPGYTIAQAWCAVLAHAQYRRADLRQQIRKGRLDPDIDPESLITIYAGDLTEESLATVRQRMMRDFIIQRLHQLSVSKPGSGTSSVQALTLLGKLYGVPIGPPRRKTAPSQGAVTRITVSPGD